MFHSEPRGPRPTWRASRPPPARRSRRPPCRQAPRDARRPRRPTVRHLLSAARLFALLFPTPQSWAQPGQQCITPGRFPSDTTRGSSLGSAQSGHVAKARRPALPRRVAPAPSSRTHSEWCAESAESSNSCRTIHSRIVAFEQLGEVEGELVRARRVGHVGVVEADKDHGVPPLPRGRARNLIIPRTSPAMAPNSAKLTSAIEQYCSTDAGANSTSVKARLVDRRWATQTRGGMALGSRRQRATSPLYRPASA
jgi:hypothetical protein